jgi:TPR repeat protein
MLYEEGAGQGCVAAKVGLAVLQLRGQGGFVADPAGAAALVEEEARGGNAVALEWLGSFHLRGERPFTKDASLAKDFLQRARQKGNTFSCSILGDIAKNAKYYSEARVLYLEAARSKATLGEANYELGLLYEDGHGVTVSKEEAVRHYRIAAYSGYGLAQLRLGQHYVNEENLEEAEQWLKQALPDEALGDLAKTELTRVQQALRAEKEDCTESSFELPRKKRKAPAKNGGANACRARSSRRPLRRSSSWLLSQNRSETTLSLAQSPEADNGTTEEATQPQRSTAPARAGTNTPPQAQSDESVRAISPERTPASPDHQDL